MTFRLSLPARLFAFLFLSAFLSAAAFAGDTRDRTQWGSDINIGPGEQPSEVTCFGCGVHVRGKVTTDVTAFFGSVVVEEGGGIGGDTTAFGGDVRLDHGVKVGGDVVVFGGRVRRDPAASVGGDITDFASPLWLALIFGLPLAILGAFAALIIWIIRRLTQRAVPAAA